MAHRFFILQKEGTHYEKAISLILALILCLSLCACGSGEQNNDTTGKTEDSSTNNTTTDSTTASTSGTDNNENNQPETPSHPLVQDICGEWKPCEDSAPFQVLVINEDGSCVVDGIPATWAVEQSYTADIYLSIRVFMDGKIHFGMVYNASLGNALLTHALDPSFANSPMYFGTCGVEKTQN